MRTITCCLLAAGVLLVHTPIPASAYIGPGAGLSALGTVVALVGAFFLMLLGFVWYPIKRLLSRKKRAAFADKTDPTDSKQ